MSTVDPALEAAAPAALLVKQLWMQCLQLPSQRTQAHPPAVPSGSLMLVGAAPPPPPVPVPAGCARAGEATRRCSVGAAATTAGGAAARGGAAAGRSGRAWPMDSAIARASCSSSLSPARAAAGWPLLAAAAVGAAPLLPGAAAALPGSAVTVSESPDCTPRDATVAPPSAGHCSGLGGKPPRT